MKIRIFCSYAHSDVEVVKQLIADLEQAGYEVWRDADDLKPGDPWWNEILNAIEACHIFLLAVSQSSLSSIYCQAEWEYALSLNKPLLPVKVNRDADKAILPDDLKLVQVGEIIDAKALADKTPVIKVLGAITSLLQKPYTSPMTPPQRPSLPKTLIDELSKQVQALKSLTPDEQAQLVHHLKQLRDYDQNPQVRRRAEEELSKLALSPYATQQAREQTGSLPRLKPSVHSAPPATASAPRWLVGVVALLALAVVGIAAVMLLSLNQSAAVGGVSTETASPVPPSPTASQTPVLPRSSPTVSVLTQIPPSITPSKTPIPPRPTQTPVPPSITPSKTPIPPRPTQTPVPPSITPIPPRPTQTPAPFYPAARSAIVPSAPLWFSDDFTGTRLNSSRWYVSPSSATALVNFGMVRLEGDESLVYRLNLNEGDAMLLLVNMDSGRGIKNLFVETQDAVDENDPNRRLWGFSINSSDVGQVTYCSGERCLGLGTAVNLPSNAWYYVLLWLKPDGKFQVAVWNRFAISDANNDYLLNLNMSLPGDLWTGRAWTFSASASEGAVLRISSAERLRLPPDYRLPNTPPR